MTRKPATHIKPRPLSARQQHLTKEWLIQNQQRIAELDAIIARSSGIVVFSNYAKAGA